MNPKVDWFFSKDTKWQELYSELRLFILDTGLTEELKWGCPCYTFENSNIVLIHGFKEYCALLFMRGALLNDGQGILVQQTENVQSARQIRFTHLEQVLSMESTLKAYIKEAVEVERAGLKVALKETAEFKMTAEFQQALQEMPELKTAFEVLTPGRQRGYLLHFSAASQTSTRQARIEKYIPWILAGKGLNDK